MDVMRKLWILGILLIPTSCNEDLWEEINSLKDVNANQAYRLNELREENMNLQNAIDTANDLISSNTDSIVGNSEAIKDANRDILDAVELIDSVQDDVLYVEEFIVSVRDSLQESIDNAIILFETESEVLDSLIALNVEGLEDLQSQVDSIQPVINEYTINNITEDITNLTEVVSQTTITVSNTVINNINTVYCDTFEYIDGEEPTIDLTGEVGTEIVDYGGGITLAQAYTDISIGFLVIDGINYVVKERTFNDVDVENNFRASTDGTLKVTLIDECDNEFDFSVNIEAGSLPPANGVVPVVDCNPCPKAKKKVII